jgi:hypothetical protein
MASPVGWPGRGHRGSQLSTQGSGPADRQRVLGTGRRDGHRRHGAGGVPVTHVGRTRRVVPALLAMMLGAALFSALPGAPPASGTGRPHGGSGGRRGKLPPRSWTRRRSSKQRLETPTCRSGRRDVRSRPARLPTIPMISSTVRSPTRFRWPALMVMAQGRSLPRFRLRGVAA